MIEPTENDIGRTVSYRAEGGVLHEVGIVRSFNAQYVFVDYPERTVMATAREDLEWVFPQ